MTPGSDGVLPDGFVEWECGVVYTVRPELLRRLQPQREYLLNVTVRRRVPADEESVEYTRLYHRAADLARARLEIVAGRNEHPLHSWIQAHAWMRQQLGAYSFASATITSGVIIAADGPLPTGEGLPSSAALLAPGGLEQGEFAARHTDAAGRRHFDEVYTEFDMRSAPRDVRDMTVSYGEYTEEVAGSIAPYLNRAEELAAFYLEPTAAAVAAGSGAPVLKREWTVLRTDKQTDPHLVSVHLFLRL